jgi:hypothetical protein
LAKQIEAIDAQLATIDAELAATAKSDEKARR